MKKLKPLHWILIAVLLVEAIVLGVWFGSRGETPQVEQQTELLLNYNANEDGSFSLLSLIATAEAPTLKFTYQDKEYTYDMSLIEMVEAYKSFDKFKEYEPEATNELWLEFQDQLTIATHRQTNKQHASIEYIRDIAKDGYGVPHEQLYDNRGMYTINAVTTINNWESVFKDYLVKGENGETVSELALGATVRIGDKDYNAIVYTMVNADEDSSNNSTAEEVSVHILFGDHILSDIDLSEATIYYLKPDGSAYFAHSNIKLTYMANSNEARYRDILILGGLQ